MSRKAQLVGKAQSAPDSPESRTAASELLGRYQKAVYLWAFRYVKEHEQALDLAQDVLITAYQRLPSFEGRSKFSSWLFAITRNRCLNETKRVTLLGKDGAEPDDMPGKGPSPDEVLEEQEKEENILSLLRTTLDPLEQKAIVLRCYERLPVDEVTRLLDVDSSSGARAVLQRARRKLKAALSEAKRLEGEA